MWKQTVRNVSSNNFMVRANSMSFDTFIQSKSNRVMEREHIGVKAGSIPTLIYREREVSTSCLTV